MEFSVPCYEANAPDAEPKIDSDEALKSGSMDLAEPSADEASDGSEIVNDDDAFRAAFATFKPQAKANILKSIKDHSFFPHFLEYRARKHVEAEFGSDLVEDVLSWNGWLDQKNNASWLHHGFLAGDKNCFGLIAL